MSAIEIVNELKSGKPVAIRTDDAFVFMREVERHGITCEGINMSFRGAECILSIESASELTPCNN